MLCPRFVFPTPMPVYELFARDPKRGRPFALAELITISLVIFSSFSFLVLC